MIIVNLAFINTSNGMFWYALDKLRTAGVDTAACVVLVQPALAGIVAREVPCAAIWPCSKLQAIRYIVQRKIVAGSDPRLITFTPHPLPFLARQTVAFYDDYPFCGRAGVLKRWLFIAAVRSSRCRIGIINRSLALPFLADCGVAPERIFFDSAFPVIAIDDHRQRPDIPADPIRIGLVGTDSRKKDYASVFRAALETPGASDVQFLLYGMENDYTQDLRREFPDIDLSIISSDTTSMPDFFAQIDYLVSASRGEGYGRPMGLAAKLGVPLFLLKSPVFLEFFGECARFFDTMGEMMRYLIAARPPAVSATFEGVAEVSRGNPFFD